MKISGKTALVTGGAHRVGRAIGLELARAGANLVINYHSSPDLATEAAVEARALGVEALTFQADVADLTQVRSMAAAARERFGGVDILVNSASLWKETPFPMANFGPWHQVTGIMLHGAAYCANEVAPTMLERGEGAIVNIVDLSVWQPWPDRAAHTVGKSALLALTRQLALDLAPAVRVNAVAPGLVLPPPGYTTEEIKRMARRNPQGRWGTPQDVARAVRFLVEADFITGQVIRVDGGESLWNVCPED